MRGGFGVSSVIFLTVSRILFPRFHSPQVDTDEQSRLLDVARIVTKHSKGCDKFCVLTMSLYTFISLLYKALSSYYSTRC